MHINHFSSFFHRSYRPDQIFNLIREISPFDPIERAHRQDALDWIASRTQIFRLEKPDIPNKHLVSYFVPFDPVAKKILLCDHKKSGLWLPPGGHVEPNEHPKETVIRECQEELGVHASFFQEDPLFVTVTVTVGMTAGHTDVSLWYVLAADHRAVYHGDENEFHQIQWFDLDHIPFERADPHLARFIGKLKMVVGG